MTVERRHVGKRMSQIVIHRAAQTVYLAGQVAEDPKCDLPMQTRQVLASIDRLLQEAGTDKSKLLSATVYLLDMKDFPTMNEVWEAWVPEGATPARATVQAAMASPGYRIEIQVVAAL